MLLPHFNFDIPRWVLLSRVFLPFRRFTSDNVVVVSVISFRALSRESLSLFWFYTIVAPFQLEHHLYPVVLPLLFPVVGNRRLQYTVLIYSTVAFKEMSRRDFLRSIKKPNVAHLKSGGFSQARLTILIGTWCSKNFDWRSAFRDL